MGIQKTVKSNQEQATASWINYLNQLRLDKLVTVLSQEEGNLSAALDTIRETLKTISKDIVNNGKGRGGISGMHGFIAEVAECGIGNARSQIEGNAPIYTWINDNGPEDLRRGAVLIQQKFVQSGNHLSLQAIQSHLNTYPDFVSNGGVYQIPADHYDKIEWLLSISEHDANRMPTSTGEFSLKQWKEVHEFFENGTIPKEKIEPSALDYDSVQREAYQKTLQKEKEALQNRNQERKCNAYQQSKPSFSEGAVVTVVSAVLEGGVTFGSEIVKKKKQGKKLKDFDADDWKNISKVTSGGFGKGAVRGVSIYMLSNYTATPAAVANSLVTVSFGVAEQTYLFRKGKLNQLEFIENSEMLCVDAAVSALSSIAGQVLIPVPILGAIIGNTVGSIMLQIAKNHLSSKEEKLIEEYLKSIYELDNKLQEQYQSFIDELNKDLLLYMSILNRAFAPDIRIAFKGSIDLAKQAGVPQDEILDTQEKIESYFLD